MKTYICSIVFAVSSLVAPTAFGSDDTNGEAVVSIKRNAEFPNVTLRFEVINKKPPLLVWKSKLDKNTRVSQIVMCSPDAKTCNEKADFNLTIGIPEFSECGDKLYGYIQEIV